MGKILTTSNAMGSGEAIHVLEFLVRTRAKNNRNKISRIIDEQIRHIRANSDLDRALWLRSCLWSEIDTLAHMFIQRFEHVMLADSTYDAGTPQSLLIMWKEIAREITLSVLATDRVIWENNVESESESSVARFREMSLALLDDSATTLNRLIYLSNPIIRKHYDAWVELLGKLVPGHKGISALALRCAMSHEEYTPHYSSVDLALQERLYAHGRVDSRAVARARARADSYANRSAALGQILGKNGIVWKRMRRVMDAIYTTGSSRTDITRNSSRVHDIEYDEDGFEINAVECANLEQSQERELNRAKLRDVVDRNSAAIERVMTEREQRIFMAVYYWFWSDDRILMEFGLTQGALYSAKSRIQKKLDSIDII